MINKLRQKAKTHRSIIENFSYLSALQVFNMILPLITYPYLIRVLGKETFGMVVYAQAFIAYLVILVNFGFNLSATKEISIHRDNKEKLNEIVSSVFILKGVLFVFSFLILTILIWIIPNAKNNWVLYYLSMYMCLYELIFPIWYFQGVEQMKYIAYLNFISRIFFLILIFLLIKAPSDYLLLPAINGLGAIVAGSLALYILLIKHKVKFVFQSFGNLLLYFKEAAPFFISNISIQIYVNANKIIIGSFLGMAEVAYYDLAEKIVAILKIPQGLVNQSIFPKINREKDSTFVKRMFKISVSFVFIISIVTIVMSKYIILVLGGRQMIDATDILRILILSVPLIAMSNFFAILLLIPFGYKKKFVQIILQSGLLYGFLFFIIYITNNIGLYQITILTVLVEIYVTTHSYFECKKFKIF